MSRLACLLCFCNYCQSRLHLVCRCTGNEKGLAGLRVLDVGKALSGLLEALPELKGTFQLPCKGRLQPIMLLPELDDVLALLSPTNTCGFLPIRALC